MRWQSSTNASLSRSAKSGSGGRALGSALAPGSGLASASKALGALQAGEIRVARGVEERLEWSRRGASRAAGGGGRGARVDAAQRLHDPLLHRIESEGELAGSDRAEQVVAPQQALGGGVEDGERPLPLAHLHQAAAGEQARAMIARGAAHGLSQESQCRLVLALGDQLLSLLPKRGRHRASG
jgi:hypothetical protein